MTDRLALMGIEHFVKVAAGGKGAAFRAQDQDTNVRHLTGHHLQRRDEFDVGVHIETIEKIGPRETQFRDAVGYRQIQRLVCHAIGQIQRLLW